jgi:hypothetical protein
MLNEYAGGSQVAYENWLASSDPALAQTVANVAQPGDDWVTAVSRAIQVAGLTYSQAQLLRTQQARMAAGQPPLNAGQYGLGVNVGLDPNTMKLVGFGVAVVALLFLVKRKR